MNRIGKFARVAVLSAYLSATLMIPSALAVDDPIAGTVAIADSHPIGVPAVAPMFQRKIKTLGDQAPAVGYRFSSAQTEYAIIAGGTVPPSAPLDQKNGGLGTLTMVNNQSILAEQITNINTGPGAYMVVIKVRYLINEGTMVKEYTVSSQAKSVNI